jgi:hypothetical protein
MPGRTAEDVSGQPDPPLERDRPIRSAGADLRGRLAELPPSHPSGAGYAADRRLPTAESPARREPLTTGELERVGQGVVDERASRFQPRERRLADFLASEGRSVVAIHDGYGREGRKPDAAVDGVWTEFKSLDPGASDTTVKAALTSAKGQARQVAIDGRESGLGRAEAEQGMRRFLGTPYADRLDAIRIVGDDFDLNWKGG